MEKKTNISEEDVKTALSKVMHPEINYSLLELGMIKDIGVEKGDVNLTLVLPFMEIPIKTDLINIIEESVKQLGRDIKLEIKTAEMDEKEKEKFMEMAQQGWKL